MRRTQRILFLATFVAIMPVLAGCADFDVDKLDVFGLTEKKKLAGDRQPVFPEGVPGVTQGVPTQYIKGNQPPPEVAVVVPPPEAAPPPAEKPKPKRKVAAKPKPVAAAPVQPVSQQPQAQPQAQPQQAQQGWPQPAPQQQSGGTASWPAPPPAGTFSR